MFFLYLSVNQLFNFIDLYGFPVLRSIGFRSIYELKSPFLRSAADREFTLDRGHIRLISPAPVRLDNLPHAIVNKGDIL